MIKPLNNYWLDSADFDQNYLLFGHILKCSVVPKAQVHDDLFKGGNKRFKVGFSRAPNI